MRSRKSSRVRITSAVASLSVLFIFATQQSQAQVFVPGTGTKIADVGDDFEDEKWSFVHNFPKSSRNIDKRERQPTGYSTNGNWFESPKRGQPDLIKRVDTPFGGIPGSKGALLLRTLRSGIPSRRGRVSHQDDFIMSGYSMTPSRRPSTVVRVYLPPFEEWENNTGTSFGFRAGLQTTIFGKDPEAKGFKKFLSIHRRRTQSYWPGLFIQFNSKSDSANEEDSAVFIIRARETGHDFMGPTITKTGWWTLGMSFSPDGRVHYFASPGVDNLRMSDHIASTKPYGYKTERFNTIFFNIANDDNGRDWSTRWIIDDPAIYYATR